MPTSMPTRRVSTNWPWRRVEFRDMHRNRLGGATDRETKDNLRQRQGHGLLAGDPLGQPAAGQCSDDGVQQHARGDDLFPRVARLEVVPDLEKRT